MSTNPYELYVPEVLLQDRCLCVMRYDYEDGHSNYAVFDYRAKPSTREHGTSAAFVSTKLDEVK